MDGNRLTSTDQQDRHRQNTHNRRQRPPNQLRTPAAPTSPRPAQPATRRGRVPPADTIAQRTLLHTSHLELLDDTSIVRFVAFTKLGLVDAYTQSRKVDHAAEVLGDTAVLVTRNRSVRLVQQLHDSRRQLEPWKHTRAVRTLDDKLRAYGLVGSASTS